MFVYVEDHPLGAPLGVGQPSPTTAIIVESLAAIELAAQIAVARMPVAFLLPEHVQRSPMQVVRVSPLSTIPARLVDANGADEMAALLINYAGSACERDRLASAAARAFRVASWPLAVLSDIASVERRAA
jgi:hypothetical protein